ncbi:MAG: hypothetical protein JKX88_10505, partial [Marinicaulis sp.]|nr:hypothetical protein [Marinicaulis sp.]
MRQHFPAVMGKPVFVIDIARSLQTHRNTPVVTRHVTRRQTSVLPVPMTPIVTAAPNIQLDILPIRPHGMGDTGPGIQIEAIASRLITTAGVMEMGGALETPIMGMVEAV